MRTIHLGLRVADTDRSVAFYTAVGYDVVGRVGGTPIGDLTMLKLPADEFVTIELVHDPDHDHARQGGALSHLVIATESMDDTIAELSARGIDVEPPTSPDGSDDFLTTCARPPPANRIVLRLTTSSCPFVRARSGPVPRDPPARRDRSTPLGTGGSRVEPAGRTWSTTTVVIHHPVIGHDAGLASCRRRSSSWPTPARSRPEPPSTRSRLEQPG